MTARIRRVRREFGTTHVVAECQDCTWRSDDYRRARENARRHAARNGHRVSVDVGVTGYYDGRET